VSYYSIVTNAGLAAQAAAQGGGPALVLEDLAVGEGDVDPTDTQTALQRQQYRIAIQRITVDPNNAKILIVEATIPASVGGWMIREVGVFTSADVLFAVGKLPEFYKPTANEGSTNDITLRVHILLTSTSDITLTIPPSAVFATKTYVDSKVGTGFTGTAPIIVTGQNISLQTGTGASAVALGNHRHDSDYYTESEIDGFLSVLSGGGGGTGGGGTGGGGTTGYVGVAPVVINNAGAISLTRGAGHTFVPFGDHVHDSKYYTKPEINSKLSAITQKTGQYTFAQRFGDDITLNYIIYGERVRVWGYIDLVSYFNGTYQSDYQSDNPERAGCPVILLPTLYNRGSVRSEIWSLLPNPGNTPALLEQSGSLATFREGVVGILSTNNHFSGYLEYGVGSITIQPNTNGYFEYFTSNPAILV